MKRTILFLLCFGYIDLSRAARNLGGNDIEPTGRMLSIQSDMMIPGPRVEAMNRTSAICTANMNGNPEVQVATERTEINYYYAIESKGNLTTVTSEGRSIIRLLENKLYRAIRPAILWCYYDTMPPSRKLGADKTSLTRGDRKLSLEEARRLSIVSFTNTPEDSETEIECNFPTEEDTNCIVMKGKVTMMHHATSDIRLARASIYDSTQKAMDFSDIYLKFRDSENTVDITNIEWLGETEQDAINGGPNGFGVIVPVEVVVEVQEQEDDEGSLLAYALAIPILILIALALLLTKNKVKRKVVTKEQLDAASFDSASIGRGMPLETVAEGVPFDPSAHSAHRKRFFVGPSENALGVKHSAIDVHNCNSARCPICVYKPKNVEFVHRDEETIEFIEETVDVENPEKGESVALEVGLMAPEVEYCDSGMISENSGEHSMRSEISMRSEEISI